VLTKTQLDNNTEPSSHTPVIAPPEGMNKVFSAILSSPGPIVSFSVLLAKGLFRRITINNMSGRKLMMQAVEEMSLLDLGIVRHFYPP